MMYPFLTMNDHTEIVYSHLLDGGGVNIYVEKPDEYDGFHHAACFLPGCRWEDTILFVPRSVDPLLFLQYPEELSLHSPRSSYYFLKILHKLLEMQNSYNPQHLVPNNH